MLKNRKFLAYALVIVSTLVATFTFYFWQVANSPNLNVDGKKTYVLYLNEGANYETVLDSLHKHKLIHNEVSFAFLSKLMKYREKVKPGRYEIPANSGNKEILSKLRAGLQDPVRLTFNNIRTKDDLVKKIDTKFKFSGDDLKALMNNEEVCAKYGFSAETIMCMLLPDTYFVYWTTTPEEFLDKMKSEYDKFWTAERLEKAKSINMSPVQVAIMASIVQSETNKKDEMPVVAGAYVNRIAQNMPFLGADPTVKFAVGDFSLKRILHKHLAFQSPYNTYINTGLPPGPIALPERVALESVLNYQKHNYVYFCAKEDFSGYHNFAVTYQDHLKNADIYQKALDARGIK